MENFDHLRSQVSGLEDLDVRGESEKLGLERASSPGLLRCAISRLRCPGSPLRWLEFSRRSAKESAGEPAMSEPWRSEARRSGPVWGASCGLSVERR